MRPHEKCGCLVTQLKITKPFPQKPKSDFCQLIFPEINFPNYQKPKSQFFKVKTPKKAKIVGKSEQNNFLNQLIRAID